MSETFIVTLIVIIVGLLLVSIPVVILTDVSAKDAFKFWISFIFLFNMLILLTYFMLASIELMYWYTDYRIFDWIRDFSYDLRVLFDNSLMYEFEIIVAANREFIIDNFGSIWMVATILSLIIFLSLIVMTMVAFATVIRAIWTERSSRYIKSICTGVFFVCRMGFSALIIAWFLCLFVEIDLSTLFWLVLTTRVLLLIYRNKFVRYYSDYIKFLGFTMFACVSVAFIVTFMLNSITYFSVSFLTSLVWITFWLMIAYLATNLVVRYIFKGMHIRRLHNKYFKARK
ncbi:hypothetical protein [Candidatus Epulonipiscium viviparus]|uniref:hypothetical protein n=1 Tax=Candidatus Epulonipiscium viviparus TaxID=420336 RepID=UPI0027380D2E|nr:hypothetical protein [Candidatus Epulopiscium viviparus]